PLHVLVRALQKIGKGDSPLFRFSAYFAGRARPRGYHEQIMIRLAALTIAFCALAIPRLSFAQVSRCEIAGTVKDESGAVIPGAEVFATNLATKVAVNRVTGAPGTFVIADLSPGAYRVDVVL